MHKDINTQRREPSGWPAQKVTDMPTRPELEEKTSLPAKAAQLLPAVRVSTSLQNGQGGQEEGKGNPPAT